MTAFTPGFRLFFGFFVVGVIAAVAYGVATGSGGGSDYLGIIDQETWTGVLTLGWSGGVGDHVGYAGLMGFAATSLFVALLLAAFRDADPESVAELTTNGEIPPPQPYVAPSYWPPIGAFGAGVTIIGLVTHAAIFIVGLILVSVVIVEWMMTAWADRASGDPVANRQLRTRLMRPIEAPVLAAGGLAILTLAFARVLLTVSKLGAVWVATGVAGLVFLLGVAYSAAPRQVNKNVTAGLVAVLAVAVLAAGIASTASGTREFREHEPETVEATEGALE